MKKSVNCLVYWTPRVLAILFILFISLFALDVFGEGPFLMQLLGFIIHLIPTYVLILFTLISWKYELFGGIMFPLLGLFYITMSKNIIATLIISGPLVLIGALFILNYVLKKRGGDNMACAKKKAVKKTAAKKTTKKKTAKKKK